MSDIKAELDLNSLESFNFLYKNLWSMDIAYRVKFNILDTILFHNGAPHYWIFTSEKTGEIMKKKSERLQSVDEIVKALKLRSRSLKGYKDAKMKNKIATVWYLETSRKISCYIVDEVELKSIMENNLGEILCIQAFMGGQTLKGNGVFEHRMWTQRDHSQKNITYEMIDSSEESRLSRFTSDGSDKLIVTEHQHGILCNLCRHLASHIGLMNNAKVSCMIFQVVFAAGWFPFIVASRKIQLVDAPIALLIHKEEVVYPCGSAPQLPAFNPQALTLPMSSTEHALRANGEALSYNRRHSSGPHLDSYGNYVAELEGRASATQQMMKAAKQEEVEKALSQARTTADTTAAGNASGATTTGTTVGDGAIARSSSAKSSSQKQQKEQSSKPVRHGSSGRHLSSKDTTTTSSSSRGNTGTGTGSHSPTADASRAAVLDPNGSTRSSAKSGKNLKPVADRSSSGKSSSEKHINPGLGIHVNIKPSLQRAFTGGALYDDLADKQLVDAQDHSADGEAIGAIPDMDPTRGASSVKYSADDMYATVNMAARPSQTHTLQQHHQLQQQQHHHPNHHQPSNHVHMTPTAPLSLQYPHHHNQKSSGTTTGKRPHSASGTYRSSRGSTSKLASSTGRSRNSAAAGPAREEYPTPPRSPPIVRTLRPQSASSVGRLRASTKKASYSMTAAAGAAGNHFFNRHHHASSNTSLLSSNPGEGAGYAVSSNGVSNKSAAVGSDGDFPIEETSLREFERPTEASRSQTSFHRQQRQGQQQGGVSYGGGGGSDLAGPGVVMLAGRRPISAPHSTRIRSVNDKDVQPRSERDEDYLEDEDLVGPRHPAAIRRVPGKSSYGAGAGGRTKEFYKFDRTAAQLTRGEGVSKVAPIGGLLCFGSYCQFDETTKAAAQNELDPSRKHIHSNHCGHQLAFKSILLARAETKFLGCDLDENIESLIDQIRLSTVTSEQLYTYFVRRHLNRVAQKCQEEARKLAFGDGQAPAAQLADLNAVYRRLVYADALAAVHPSRFYYSVPICEMCYRIYTFMDAQREMIVLHSPDSHQLSTAAAAAAAQFVRMSAQEREDKLWREEAHRAQADRTHYHHHKEQQKRDKEEYRHIQNRTNRPGSSSSSKKEHFTTSDSAKNDPLKEYSPTQLSAKLGQSDGGGGAVSAGGPVGAMAAIRATRQQYHYDNLDDPYQDDDLVHTSDFIPHHSAQRDVYVDDSKKGTYANQLRSTVRLQNQHAQEEAEEARLRESPLGRLKRRRNPTSTLVPHSAAAPHVPCLSPKEHLHGADKRASRVVRETDRVPRNACDDDRRNETFDSGIGSKGPQHADLVSAQQVAAHQSGGGTITTWIRLLREKTAAAGGGPSRASAEYERQHKLQSGQEWDHQGAAPHLRPTASSNRHKSRGIERPNSAQSHRRPASAGAVAGVRGGGGTNTSAGAGIGNSKPTTTINVRRGSSSGDSASRPRPSSAGAVPNPSSRSRGSKHSRSNNQSSVARAEGEWQPHPPSVGGTGDHMSSAQQQQQQQQQQEAAERAMVAQELAQEAAAVAALSAPSEREIAMAKKMMQLSNHLSAFAIAPQYAFHGQQNQLQQQAIAASTAGSAAGVVEGTVIPQQQQIINSDDGIDSRTSGAYRNEVSSAYAYSSLPFMDAPYLPAAGTAVHQYAPSSSVTATPAAASSSSPSSRRSIPVGAQPTSSNHNTRPTTAADEHAGMVLSTAVEHNEQDTNTTNKNNNNNNNPPAPARTTTTATAGGGGGMYSKELMPTSASGSRTAGINISASSAVQLPTRDYWQEKCEPQLPSPERVTKPLRPVVPTSEFIPLLHPHPSHHPLYQQQPPSNYHEGETTGAGAGRAGDEQSGGEYYFESGEEEDKYGDDSAAPVAPRDDSEIASSGQQQSQQQQQQQQQGVQFDAMRESAESARSVSPPVFDHLVTNAAAQDPAGTNVEPTQQQQQQQQQQEPQEQQSSLNDGSAFFELSNIDLSNAEGGADAALQQVPNEGDGVQGMLGLDDTVTGSVLSPSSTAPMNMSQTLTPGSLPGAYSPAQRDPAASYPTTPAMPSATAASVAAAAAAAAATASISLTPPTAAAAAAAADVGLSPLTNVAATVPTPQALPPPSATLFGDATAITTAAVAAE